MAKVLIVDDEVSIRRTLGEFLRADGHEAAEAADAESALALLNQAQFDIIVTDIIMPRMSGVDLLHRLRAIAPQSLVIMMTGEPTIETATETLRAGAVDYVFKPITKADILRVVTNAIRLKTLAEAKQLLEEQNLAYQKDLEQLVAERTRQLQASEQKAQQLSRFNQAVLDALIAHICVIDHEGYIVAVNRSWTHFAAANPPPARNAGVGANYFTACEAVIGEDAAVAQQVASGIRRVIARELPEFVLEYACHSQTEQRWFMMRASHFAGEGPACAVVAHHPITERKLAEQALKASEEQFRAVVESGPVGIFIQTQGKFAYVNSFAAHLLGAAPEQLIGQEVIDRIHADCRVQVQERMRLLNEVRQPAPLLEEQYLRLDGATFSVEVAAVPFTYQGQAGGLVFFRDVSDRKRLEIELRQAAKLEAVGLLAGGVAHDFNNVLAAIMLHLGLLQQNPEVPATVKDSLAEVENEAMRAAKLTRQLLVFSRRQVARTERLDLNSVVSGLLKMLRRLLGENLRVIFNSSPGPIIVNADAGMLEQVVTNLCINARDAMPRGGPLTISTAAVGFEPGGSAQGPGGRAGRFARVSVSDTGCGMAPEIIGRVFDPFFTTKPVGKGTGLGLAMVYGIVKQHEGWIDVTSEVGCGSTFDVYIPALLDAVAPSAVSVASQEVYGGSETILLVEDEPALRHSAALCLRKLGYAVLEAANGQQALEVWDKHKHEIELLLSDQVMPAGMTGCELAARLRREVPALKVILSTGYSEELGRWSDSEKQAFAILPKPYAVAAVASLVRSCLDGRLESGQTT